MGRLEALGTQLAGIAGVCPPPVPEPVAVAVFAGDHGVHGQGVTPWSQEVTVQMVANVCAGGALVNALARQMRADVVVVGVGVAGDAPPHPCLTTARIARGTADLLTGRAMSLAQARQGASRPASPTPTGSSTRGTACWSPEISGWPTRRPPPPSSRP
jgi:nicotinate-nucleotide--dimethylbenzimidazole phosphoribosyltransferase